MRFGNQIYQKAYMKSLEKSIEREYSRNLRSRLWGKGKSIMFNWFPPVLGYFPKRLQTFLKENYQQKFGQLKPEISTLTSAVIMGVFAFEIGLKLNGFDIGKITAVGEESAEVRRYVSYIGQYLPFLNLPYGIPKKITEIASYTIIADSGIRTALNISFNKPFGFIPAEGLDYVINRLSIGKKAKQEILHGIERAKSEKESIDKHIEEDRRKIEGRLAEIEMMLSSDSSNLDKLGPEIKDLKAMIGL